MRLNCRHLAPVEYGSDVGDNGGKRVTLRRGINVISDNDMAFLRASPSFRKHANAGTFVELPNEAPKTVVPATPAAPLGERDRRPGESDKVYGKRIAALNAAEADRRAQAETDAAKKAAADAEFLKTYNDLDDATKEAMAPSLTAEQKALIDGQAKA